MSAPTMSAPISLDDLVDCAPGTLGHGYRSFIVDNGLEANLARNYRDFNESLTAKGTLDRLPEDLSFTIVPVMDAMTAACAMGRAAENLHFTRWEDELDTPLAELRERVGIDPTLHQTF